MRTHLLSLLFAAFAAFAAQAQDTLHIQHFENGWPEGYAYINVDGLTPDDPDLATLADSAWAVRYITQAGWNSNCAFSVSWYVGDAGPSDDWMILPAISIPDAANTSTTLSWTGMAITSSGNFRDRYQVAISTGEPTVADFQENVLLFDTGATGEEITPQNRSVSLDAYAGQTVYIAFRNFTAGYDPDLPSGPGNGGNELMIDNILVSAQSTSAAQNPLAETLGLQAVPNPSQGLTQVRFALDRPGTVLLDVRDMAGRSIWQSAPSELPSGAHQIDVDTQGWPTGIYALQVHTASGIAVIKLMVN